MEASEKAETRVRGGFAINGDVMAGLKWLVETFGEKARAVDVAERLRRDRALAMRLSMASGRGEIQF